MGFTLSIVIRLPRPRVYELLASPDSLSHLIPGFIRIEPGTGVPGSRGATSRIVYQAGESEQQLVETILERSPPSLLAATYEIDTVIYSRIHRLEEISPGETRWTCEHASDVHRGGWLMNWLLSRALQAATRKSMAEFKAVAAQGG